MLSQSVIKASEIIKKGGVVAFPTETVYGLGANVFNPDAVAKIFEIKKRPMFDPLIVHISRMGQLDDLATTIPPLARTLVEKFWPGPLTIILPKKESVHPIVTSGLAGVGIRMPSHTMAQELLTLSETPICAPSANLFGHLSPTTAYHVEEQLGSAVEMILDGGACTVGVESTIISFMFETPLLLRPGGVPLEAIEQIIGKVDIPKENEMERSSPGRSLQHYAPLTKLFFEQSGQKSSYGNNCGIISFQQCEDASLFKVSEILSPKGDLREAACNLFAAMHRLDTLNLDCIIARAVPNNGLGRAINDRLYRASIKRNF